MRLNKYVYVLWQLYIALLHYLEIEWVKVLTLFRAHSMYTVVTPVECSTLP